MGGTLGLLKAWWRRRGLTATVAGRRRAGDCGVGYTWDGQRRRVGFGRGAALEVAWPRAPMVERKDRRRLLDPIDGKERRIRGDQIGGWGEGVE